MSYTTSADGKDTTSVVCAGLAAAVAAVVGADASSAGGATINESIVTVVIDGASTTITLSSFSIT